MWRRVTEVETLRVAVRRSQESKQSTTFLHKHWWERGSQRQPGGTSGVPPASTCCPRLLIHDWLLNDWNKWINAKEGEVCVHPTPSGHRSKTKEAYKGKRVTVCTMNIETLQFFFIMFCFCKVLPEKCFENQKAANSVTGAMISRFWICMSD